MPRKRKQHKLKENIYILIIGLLIIIAVYIVITPRISHINIQARTPSIPSQLPDPSQPEIRRLYHIHVDFLVVINGEEVNFNRPEFDYVNPLIHLHIPNFMGDNIIHIESRNATMGDFFSSLGMKLNNTCFVAEENDYCNSQNKTLKMYVNAITSNEFDKYNPKDLDKVLISYGDESKTEIQKQIESVTNLACIFSLQCLPPPEAENNILYN